MEGRLEFCFFRGGAGKSRLAQYVRDPYHRTEHDSQRGHGPGRQPADSCVPCLIGSQGYTSRDGVVDVKRDGPVYATVWVDDSRVPRAGGADQPPSGFRGAQPEKDRVLTVLRLRPPGCVEGGDNEKFGTVPDQLPHHPFVVAVETHRSSDRTGFGGNGTCLRTGHTVVEEMNGMNFIILAGNAFGADGERCVPPLRRPRPDDCFRPDDRRRNWRARQITGGHGGSTEGKAS